MGTEPKQCAKQLVLVVDDEHPMRNIMAFDLAARGFDVREAESVAAAIELLAGLAFDVVITDLRFPASSGLDLVRWVQSQAGSRPVVVVTTGQLSDAMRQDLVANGVAAILEKPYLEAELDLALTAALARRRAAD